MAFLSKEDKLNIIGIFKAINANSFPIIHPKLSCAVNITIDKPATLKLQILEAKNKEMLSKIEAKLDPKFQGKEEIEIGFIGDFMTLKFEKPGIYDLEIWLDEDLVETKSFAVNQLGKK
jgi:hypothetical protein